MDDDLWVSEPRAGYEFESLSGRVIAAAIAVHKQLGPGFREEIYENALCIEFVKQSLRFSRQAEVNVHYEGKLVGKHALDFLVEDRIVLELKSVAVMLDVHYAQLRGYLRATGLRVGLILNFGEHPLGIKRMVNRYDG
jgi:GxxExxY protein